MTTTRSEVIERMIGAGQRLAPDLRRQLVAAGTTIVPELIAVLEDEALALEDAPGEGYAPIHAVDVLHELRAPEAIAPMLRELVRSEPLSILRDRLLVTLPAFGAAALGPAWALYEQTADADARASLRGVLARLGVRDARVFRELLADLAVAPDRAAMHLAEYGDPDAVPHLQRALLRQTVDTGGGGVFANQALIELRAAIEDLGGELTPAMDAKLAAVDAARRAALAPLQRALASPAQRASKVGRNDPCPCGSGKKYKKCCLAAAT